MSIRYQNSGHASHHCQAVRERAGFNPLNFAMLTSGRRIDYMQDAVEADTTNVLALIDSQNQVPERVSAYFKTEIQPQTTLACGILNACLTPRRFSTATIAISA